MEQALPTWHGMAWHGRWFKLKHALMSRALFKTCAFYGAFVVTFCFLLSKSFSTYSSSAPALAFICSLFSRHLRNRTTSSLLYSSCIFSNNNTSMGGPGGLFFLQLFLKRTAFTFPRYARTQRNALSPHTTTLHFPAHILGMRQDKVK